MPKTITEWFEYYKNQDSDINEHLDTLVRYASECDHVTEMGVREVVSTWAFLEAKPKRLVSIDIVPCPVKEAKKLAKKAGIDFEFIQADTTDTTLDIEPTDLLFIDTLHVYEQLFKELELHSNKAKKYIILHDTTKFGERGEGDPRLLFEGDERIHLISYRLGLIIAIQEFLLLNPNWYVKEQFTNNNGLTVLARNE